MEAARTTNRKLSLGEKLSYGMGDCGANVIVALASTYRVWRFLLENAYPLYSPHFIWCE